MLHPALIALFVLAPWQTPAEGEGGEAPSSTAEAAPKEVPLEALPDDKQAELLLDKDNPRAKEGVVVGARGIDPGWKDSRVAERSPNIWGQTGLRRVNSARAHKSGYFDIGLHGRAFYLSDFIAPGADENTFFGGTASFGVSIFDIVEIGLASQFASNENTLAVPATTFTTGDFFPSIKVAYTILPVAFGLDVRGSIPTSQDAVGVDLPNFGVSATGLFTLDLYEAWDVPFRLHLNAGYAYQNAHVVGAQQYFARDVAGHLLALTTGQWYYDQLLYGVGVELPFPHVTPYAELWGQTAIGVAPGQGARGADYSFLDSHITFTPGVRLSVGRGLNFDLALDVGLGGTGGFFAPDVSKLVPGQPINPAYAVHFGVSYTFSPFVAETQVEVREKEVPMGRVKGCVVDEKSKKPVQEAYVEFTGTEGPRIVVDDQGCFISPNVGVGDLVVKVKHPDYEPKSVTVQILDDQVVETSVALKPAPRYGQFKGNVTNLKDEAVDAVLLIEDEDKQMAEYSTEGGAFEIQLAPGRYQVVVRAEGYLQTGAPVLIEPLGKTIRNFILKPLPKKRISLLKKDKIEISSRIPFEYNKSRLLKASEFILDDVVDLILSNPQIKMIRIEGHTDDTGSEEYNQQLSEARAQAVLEYLVSKGVPAERLQAVGYGFTRPLAPNDTEEGRAKNRRVEFVIVDQGEEAPKAPPAEDAPPEDGE